MATQKRPHDTADPDYTDIGEVQAKKQRLIEQDAKEAVTKKIQDIIHKEFEKEISDKERELLEVDQRLNKARVMMDRLRACIVANYYGQTKASSSSMAQLSTLTAPPPSVHPAIKKHISKRPAHYPQVEGEKPAVKKGPEEQTEKLQSSSQNRVSPSTSFTSSPSMSRSSSPWQNTGPPPQGAANSSAGFDDRRARTKVKRKVIVGNVSKYIPVDEREANDMSSHKWMVYVRGPKSSPDISHFVRRVWFFLHHSYKPNDLVEVVSPPFHLTRRGWGEFPVRVQLHFVDPRNKNIDIIHHLKLDKTYTGLQTLGAETVVEVDLDRHFFEASTSSAASASSDRSRSSTPTLISTEVPIPHSQSVRDTATSIPQAKFQNEFFEKKKEITEVKQLPSPSQPKNLKPQKINNDETVTSKEVHTTICHDPALNVEDADVDVCDSAVASNSKILIESSRKAMISSRNLSACASEKSLVNKTNGLNKGIFVPVTQPSIAHTISKILPNQTQVLQNTASLPVIQTPLCTLIKPEVSSVHQIKQEIPIINQVQQEFPLFHQIKQEIPSIQVQSIQAEIEPVVIRTPTTVASIIPQTVQSIPVTSVKQVLTIVNPSNLKGMTSSTPLRPTVISANKPVATSLLSKSPSASLLHNNIVFQTPNQPLKVTPNQPLKVTPNQPLQVTPNQPVKVTGQTLTAKPQQISSAPRPSSSVISLPTSQISPGANKLLLSQSADNGRKIVFMPNHQVIASSQSANAKVISARATKKVTPAVNVQQSTKPSSIPKGKQVSLLTGKIVSPKPPVLSNSPSQSVPARPVKVGLPSISGLSAAPPQTLTVSGVPQQLSDPPVNVNMIHQNGKQFLVLGSGSQTITTTSQLSLNSLPKTNQVSLLNVPNNSSRLHLPSSQQFSANTQLSSDSSLISNRSIHNSNSILLDTADKVNEKMSAVGITKLNKRLKTISPALKTEEERQQEKYEIIKAFKANPELFTRGQPKSKVACMRANDYVDGEAEYVPLLRLENFSDLQSLTRAAVKLHPLIQPDINRLTHPYCAESTEQWNNWHVAKQRANEWHRACFILKYLRQCLGGQTCFRGNNLMTTRQLVRWSRRRGLSPINAEKILLNEVKEEISRGVVEPINPTVDKWINGSSLLTPLSKLEDLLKGNDSINGSTEREEIVDVLEETPVGQREKKTVHNVSKNTENILPSEGGFFVLEFLRRRGLKLLPVELELGVTTSVTADMLYQVAMDFTSDLLREAAGASSDRSSLDLSLRDVQTALTTLPSASFFSLSCLGKEMETSGLR